MANPSGTHQERNHNTSSTFNGASSTVINSVVDATGPTALAMKHNPGISMDWTVEEQAILEEGLTKHALEPSVIRYAKIALQLQNKTVRDVALRCRWMTKKENSKRRKEEHNLMRKSKDKKERVTDNLAKPTSFMTQSSVHPYGPSVIATDYDDCIPYKAIGGLMGELLDQNAQAFRQISANLASLQIQENINLFCRARDNILKIMNYLNDMPEMTKQMPPLPVKVNEELANAILPPTSLMMQS